MQRSDIATKHFIKMHGNIFFSAENTGPIKLLNSIDFELILPTVASNPRVREASNVSMGFVWVGGRISFAYAKYLKISKCDHLMPVNLL